MGALKIILTIIFVLVSIVLTVIILMQEGKSAGLGVISGAAESYWGKNKSRSMEGKLVKFTKYLAVAFLVLAAVLNINFNRSEAASDNNSNDTVIATEETTATEDADTKADDASESDAAEADDDQTADDAQDAADAAEDDSQSTEDTEE